MTRAVGTLVLVLVACGPQVELEDDGGSSSGEASTGLAATTVSPTTASPTTEGSVTLTTGPLDPSTGVDPDDGSSTTGVEIPEDCSPIEQDCPRGYKCMPWASDGGSSWNDTRCVEIVERPGAPGEPCTVVGSGTSGEDDCDGTSMCWDVDPKTNVGTCTPFCIGTDEEPTCADPCDTCPLSGDGAITLCFPTCDPLSQDCAPGQACYPSQDFFICAPDASPEGTGIGSSCEFINVCPPGTVCLDSSALSICDQGVFGCCVPYCPVEGADPCPGLVPGSSCVPWYDGGQEPDPGQCTSATPGVCLEE